MGVDEELELDMDVLDDLVGEAKEVHEQNPWLTYAPSLHRIRERGAQSKLFDLIDEKPLALPEVRAMCELIFGPDAKALPHAEADWRGFLQGVVQLNAQEAHVRDPLRSFGGFRQKPLTREWISVKKVRKLRRDSCSIM